MQFSGQRVEIIESDEKLSSSLAKKIKYIGLCPITHEAGYYFEFTLVNFVSGCILCGCDLQDMRDLALLELFRKHDPTFPFIIMADNPPTDLVVRAMKLGATSFLDIGNGLDAIVSGVTEVIKEAEERQRLKDNLTTRQYKVLKHLVDGHEPKVIQEKLGYSSVNTIYDIRRELRSVIGANTDHDLFSYYKKM